MAVPFYRRLLQFQLRTLLVVVFVIAAILSLWREEQRTAVPLDWDAGKIPRSGLFGTGAPPGSRNIKWSAPLGHKTFGSPVVSGGRVFIGTNNAQHFLPGYTNYFDGALLCFDAQDGTLLWQATSAALTPLSPFYRGVGVASTPIVVGDRLWYVDAGGAVVCLDTAGFHDGQNDGAVVDEPTDKLEADIVWRFDVRAKLGVNGHNFFACRAATDGERLFVVTGNAVDYQHVAVPNPTAPSFIALDRQTGQLLWSDNSPGSNILHHQWGSPTYARIGGVPQVIFPGGDGWLYSFAPAGDGRGNSKLLWKFDLNPKNTIYVTGVSGDRNESAHYVTVAGNRVLAIAGHDAEVSEGLSVLWCIDATKRGDLSEEICVHSAQPTLPLPPRRMRAFDPALGELAVPNPNSGVIWKFAAADTNRNGQIEYFEENIHLVRGAVVVRDGVALVADLSGLVHCFDANTGQRKWFYDMRASCWNSPLIAGRYAYIGDEDGDIAIFDLLAKRAGQHSGKPIAEINMQHSTYSVPTASNGVLFIAANNRLYAIEQAKK
jgi:outer membrane protein assembly factor BamB